MNGRAQRRWLPFGVFATVPPSTNHPLRPRRSVVVGSSALFVGGLLLTATALPVSAVAPIAQLGAGIASTSASHAAASPSAPATAVRLTSFRRHQTPTTTTPAPTNTTPSTTVAPTTTPVPTTTTPRPVVTTTVAPRAVVYPTGTANGSEPSGVAPPGATALTGYSMSYVNDFSGTSVPAGWYSYDGQPGGDPGALFASSHVVVGGGLLQLNTFQDPAHANQWVTGGLCHCGLAQTYGAYFVRSRVTGAGPTAIELLWPAAKVWPPEIDFNESGGGASGSSATVHFGAANHQDQRGLKIDMTQWHTWGVVWSPTAIIYTVDGKVWGTVSVPSEIPNQAMTLDLQVQTFCASGWACPTAPQSMQVDWVAEYSAN